jgi:hypothetical protein
MQRPEGSDLPRHACAAGLYFDSNDSHFQLNSGPCLHGVTQHGYGADCIAL